MTSLVNFTDIGIDQIFATGGGGGDTNPFMMLIWILPIILFVFYGQRIQLYVTSGEIKKAIANLDIFKNESRKELIKYIKYHLPKEDDPTKRIDRLLDYFTIAPVDMDPAGIVDKVRHTVRNREDITREQIKMITPNVNDLELSKIQTLIEIATSLQMIYRIINHMFLTAKKQNNYPLILPLQMLLPFIMEHAKAMKESIPAFKASQPIGDGIGPMVVGKMMLNCKKEEVAFQTVMAKTEYKDRDIIILKAKGPESTVGRPAEAVELIVSKRNIDVIIMIDAALKMEGEESASIAQGFGAAIGGNGTERFQIEAIAVEKNIPVISIIVKQTVTEAITLMTKEIADSASDVQSRIYETIIENTKPGKTILLIGVGNTSGVIQ